MAARPELKITLVLAATLATLAAGCGAEPNRANTTAGRTTEGTPAAQPSSADGKPITAKVADARRRAYIARVDRICATLDPDRNSAQQRVAEAGGEREAAADYEDTIALGEKQLRRIQRVQIPADDRPLVRANVIDVIQRQLAIRRLIRRRLAAGEASGVRRLRGRLDDTTRTLVGFARGYGFRVCGED